MKNNKTEQWIVKFFTTVIMITVLLIMVLGATVPAIDEIKAHKMTDSQKQKVLKQIKLKGYKNLVANGCSSAIAEKINTGKWSDNWCANHYKHLDLE